MGDALRRLWQHGIVDVEVLRSEFDAHDYDLVMARGKIMLYCANTIVEGVGLESEIFAMIPGLGNVAEGPALTYADSRTNNPLLPLLHLVVMAAKPSGPGGVRAVIAENLVLKQQLIVLVRDRRRATLTLTDRLLCGFCSLSLSAGRIRQVAIAVRPSTLLAFPAALVRRKYRRLFSSRPCPKKPGSTPGAGRQCFGRTTISRSLDAVDRNRRQTNCRTR